LRNYDKFVNRVKARLINALVRIHTILFDKRTGLAYSIGILSNGSNQLKRYCWAAALRGSGQPHPGATA
jgi:hypothetical protein